MKSCITVAKINPTNSKEEVKITTVVNKLTGWEMMDKLARYINAWSNGWLELSEEVLKDINFLMESEAIIYEEMFKLFKRFEFTDDEANYYASLKIDEARDMQADWDLKFMLATLWEER